MSLHTLKQDVIEKNKMNFELLPNEIFLDLFDYLNGVDLLYAFYGLNTRFNFLLYKQYRTYRFQFGSISKRKFDMICHQHLPFIADRIIAFRLFDSDETLGEINLFLSYIPSFNQFTYLQSLSLHYPRSYETIMKIIHKCHHLSNLKHLCVQIFNFRGDQADYQLFVDSVWSLSNLVQCDFSICYSKQQLSYIPTEISPSLECISMLGCKLKWGEINRLFECTPHLQRLAVDIDFHEHMQYIPLPFLTLTHLRINIFGMFDISKMVCLLQNTPNLFRLNINVTRVLINGYEWEEIIRNNLHKLKTFRLKMEKRLVSEKNIEERANELLNSFRSSFWIDEHQWFVRCFTFEKTIRLYTRTKRFCHYLTKHPDSWQSTYPLDNIQEFYNHMINIHDETFLHQPIPSHIRLPKIESLHIKLPINDQFWSIVPSLNQLNSLTVSSHTDTLQSQLQDLLDRAPNLYTLRIRQERSLPLQMSLFTYRSASIRRFNLYDCNYYFNEEECIRLSQSPLGISCEVLLIQVKTRKCIIMLTERMNNLRALNVEYKDGNNSENISVLTNDECCDENTSNKDQSIQWLTDHLPSTCVIVGDRTAVSRFRIWL